MYFSLSFKSVPQTPVEIPVGGPPLARSPSHRPAAEEDVCGRRGGGSHCQCRFSLQVLVALGCLKPLAKMGTNSSWVPSLSPYCLIIMITCPHHSLVKLPCWTCEKTGARERRNLNLPSPIFHLSALSPGPQIFSPLESFLYPQISSQILLTRIQRAPPPLTTTLMSPLSLSLKCTDQSASAICWPRGHCPWCRRLSFLLIWENEHSSQRSSHVLC